MPRILLALSLLVCIGCSQEAPQHPVIKEIRPPAPSKTPPTPKSDKDPPPIYKVK